MSRMDYLYYREHVLNSELLEAVQGQDLQVKGNPPPPPPRANLMIDGKEIEALRLYLLAGDQKRESELVDEAEHVEIAQIATSTESLLCDNLPELGKLSEKPLDASHDPASRSGSSIGAELYTWGANIAFSMGIGVDSGGENNKNLEQHSPRPVPLEAPILLERIRMIACSSRHTLLLTYFGSLYSCGDNAEGALGHGDMFSR